MQTAASQEVSQQILVQSFIMLISIEKKNILNAFVSN